MPAGRCFAARLMVFAPMSARKRRLAAQGKTPAATIAARLYTDIKKNGAASRFVQAGKNTFAVNPNTPGTPDSALVVPSQDSGGDSAVVAKSGPGADAELKKRLSFTDAAE